MLGSLPVGGGAPVSVQSMTTTRTAEIDATLAQVYALAGAGADIVRVTCNDRAAAEALAEIVSRSPVPIVADIHFQHRLALAALEAGVAGLRLNPGNIRRPEQVRAVAVAAAERRVPIRVGVNAGSLDRDLLERYGGPVAEALVESALGEIHLLEEAGLDDIKVSVKHSDVPTMVEAYRLLAERTDRPFHLGVTEAGPPPAGLIKSVAGIGTLLLEGIGDTIRFSLTADPVEEARAGRRLLEILGLRERRGVDLVACPSCGRAEVDVIALAAEVERRLGMEDLAVQVAVMGCVVNGPGEARQADLGIAAGKGKGHLFVQGRVVRVVPEAEMVEALVEEARRLASGRASAPPGA
jgi:(E)-4-hydroxy-3-methylbut-2-enyl-diphosphate synthase